MTKFLFNVIDFLFLKNGLYQYVTNTTPLLPIQTEVRIEELKIGYRRPNSCIP